MAKLTTTRRNNLPASSFGMPGARKYPMPDRAHARNALSRVSQALHDDKISDGAAAKVRAKAHAILKGG
jgi:hypothetical protein